MRIPLLDLKAQYECIRDEVDAALDRVMSTQHFILGEEVSSLEREIADYSGSAHGIGCASGSDALLLSLLALDVGPGDEVICPTYTFFATAGAISRLGAIPVFVDIDPTTYNLDLDSLREQARGCRRLRALIPVHLFGQASDLEGVYEVAEECGVPVIEDAAQAIGARDRQGLQIGSRPSLTCFSFFPSKNLGGIGDGGMVVTNSDELAERIAVLRVHGSKPKYYHRIVGFNSRLDAIQAAVIRVKLKHLDSWTRKRQQNAEYYDRAFSLKGALDSSASLDAGGLPLRTPKPPLAPATHIYNQYVIRVKAEFRDPLRTHLTEQEIGNEIYYPVPLHLQACFEDLGSGPGEFPVAEALSRETLAIPVYPELSRDQLEAVVDATVGFLKASIA